MAEVQNVTITLDANDAMDAMKKEAERFVNELEGSVQLRQWCIETAMELHKHGYHGHEVIIATAASLENWVVKGKLAFVSSRHEPPTG